MDFKITASAWQASISASGMKGVEGSGGQSQSGWGKCWIFDNPRFLVSRFMRLYCSRKENASACRNCHKDWAQDQQK